VTAFLQKCRSIASAVIGLACLEAQLSGDTIEETFTTDPSLRGWRSWGDGSLFHWDATEQRLNVAWDSARPNSFFALPLPGSLTANDDFRFAFDLTLESHAVGVLAGQPGTFQIAAGLIRRNDALATNYSRGSFPGPKNTVEWTWFGEAGAVSASLSPVMIPSDGRLPWGYADSYVTLETGRHYHFELAYSSTHRTARMSMLSDGQPGPQLTDIVLPANFTRFQVDTFAISNYSGAGQNPLYAGSVLARGWIDNISITVPEPPILRLRARDGGVSLDAVAGWRYTLEASGNLTDWSTVTETLASQTAPLDLWDPRDGLFPVQFYRVVAIRP
jgi:hypothetical protein